LDAAEVEFRVYPKLWPVIRRKGPDGNTQVWSLPFGGALGKVLLYRKDLFDQHGIAYPTAAWTWDDLLAAAKKLTDPARGTYGYMSGRGKHESWFWISFLWSAGGEVMIYDEQADEWQCTFNGPGGVDALDFYTRLCAERWVDAGGQLRRGYAYKEAADAGAKWERGEIGMTETYVDERLLSTINPELTGMAPIPMGPGGHRGGELNSRMMGLSAGITDPVVRDAAWEYMRFCTSPAAEQIRTRIMVEGGFGPFVNPKYLRQFGYPELVRLSPPGWLETFEVAIASSKPEPCGKNSNIAYDLMTVPIQQAEQMMLRDELPTEPAARRAALQQLLDVAAARANREMIGIVPPAERRVRRVVASAALVAILVVFALVFRQIARTFTAPADPTRPAGGWQWRKYRWAYLLLLPAALTILVWSYVPVLRGSVMALQDYQLMRPSTWVGVDNFGDVLFDGFWWRSVWNALRYSFLVMALTFLPPIALAVLLQEVPRGKLLYRTLFYLPAVITGIVTVLLWKLFYEPSERGALNALMLRIPAIGFVGLGLALGAVAVAFARRLWLQQLNLAAWGCVGAGVLLLLTCLGLARPILFPPLEGVGAALAHLPGRLWAHPPEPYRWLGDPGTAMVACVIPMVWAGMGPGCLIYLAALRGIPDDYYEAADLDGATFIDQILFVVFPTIRPLVVINFVGAFIGSWYAAAGNILVLTGGGAGTDVAALHIWYKAFTFLKFGPATAMAWMLGFMLIGFTVHQLRLLSRVEFKTTEERK
jgi:multiple sugar transport system permease protein